MTGSITFVDVLDDAALLSLEHQIHLAELLGEHGWSVDLASSRRQGLQTVDMSSHRLVRWTYGRRRPNPPGFRGAHHHHR
jgi:hypothetical protein